MYPTPTALRLKSKAVADTALQMTRRRRRNMRPPQLRVEQLEQRVLLTTWASSYAAPLSGVLTSQNTSHASPAQTSSAPSAEYANGTDSDGSSSPAAQALIGPQLPTPSTKSSSANAYPTPVDSTSA